MSKKKGNFIDQYLDKIILGLTGAAAIYLTWALILSNPYGAKINSGKLSPSEIDSINLRQAQQIQDKLGESASPKPYSQNKAVEMSKMFEDPMPKIAITTGWPIPGEPPTGMGGGRQYVIPRIPLLGDVKLASIRGTVQMPTEEVSPEVSYLMVPSKPADIDFVTVSARVDLSILSDNFKQSFMGPRLKPQWRDPILAEPVFARIELQRRAENEEGSWGDWEAVPYNRIDPYQKTLRDIPLTTEQMTYGNVELFMNSCREFAVRTNILQPPPYEFLSTQIKWLPAQFYLETQKLTEEQEQKRLREERDQRQRERSPSNRPGAAGGGAGGAENRRLTGSQPSRGRGGREDNPMGDAMGAPVTTRPVKPTRTVQDIEKDVNAAKFDEKTKISSLKDLLVWIHDDSVVPGVTYQYRIRYGVFNPVAGKNWCAQESQQYENQVVLWSPYTEISDSVRIPKMLHMFPADVLADGTGVAVDIFRYYMGQWHTETFNVLFGQMIGKQKESKPKTGPEGMPGMERGVVDVRRPMDGMMNPNIEGMSGQPLLVDYSTGYMLLDIQTRTHWPTPSVRPQEITWMFYLNKDNRILTLPTKRSTWSREMTSEYNTVKSELSKTAEMMLDGTSMPGSERGIMPDRTQDPRRLN